VPRHSILRDREAVSQAIARSQSTREALEILGLRPAGGNYHAFRLACERFGLEPPVYQPGSRAVSAPRLTKIDWPGDEELRAMVAASSYAATGRKLGVSDTAVRKRLRRQDAEQSRLPDLNGSPSDYKSDVLPAELRRPVLGSWSLPEVVLLITLAAFAGSALVFAIRSGSVAGLAVTSGLCLVVLVVMVL
jgi:hypothetical protein